MFKHIWCHSYALVDKKKSNTKLCLKRKAETKESTFLLKSDSQGLSLRWEKFLLRGRSPPRCNFTLLGEVSWAAVFENEGTGELKPDSTRVCLSAIVDIFIRRASETETRREIRTSQPELTVRSQSVKRSAAAPLLSPRCHNTQMDCHIRFRRIGYYTLGFLFPHSSARQDLSEDSSYFILVLEFVI